MSLNLWERTYISMPMFVIFVKSSIIFLFQVFHRNDWARRLFSTGPEQERHISRSCVLLIVPWNVTPATSTPQLRLRIVDFYFLSLRNNELLLWFSISTVISQVDVCDRNNVQVGPRGLAASFTRTSRNWS